MIRVLIDIILTVHFTKVNAVYAKTYLAQNQNYDSDLVEFGWEINLSTLHPYGILLHVAYLT